MLPRPTVPQNPEEVAPFPEDWSRPLDWLRHLLQLMPTTMGAFDPTTWLPVANPPPGSKYTAYVMLDAQYSLLGQFVSTKTGTDAWRWIGGTFPAPGFGMVVRALGHDTDLSAHKANDRKFQENAFSPMAAAVTPIGFTRIYRIRNQGALIGWMWVGPTGMRWVVETAKLDATDQRLRSGVYAFESIAGPGPVGGANHSECFNAAI